MFIRARTKLTSSSYLACVSDSQTMECTYSHVHNLLPPQSFHYLWFSYMNISAVSKPEIVALAPEYKYRQIFELKSCSKQSKHLASTRATKRT